MIYEDENIVIFDNGTTFHKETRLMWAVKDNGKDVNWDNARKFCENYRSGGYDNWRMPTSKELFGKRLPGMKYDIVFGKKYGQKPATGWYWTSAKEGSKARVVDLRSGISYLAPRSISSHGRVLPVRNTSHKK